MDNHIDRWNYPKSIQSWKSQIELMRNYAKERPKYFKEHLELLFNLKLDEHLKK